MLREHEDGHHKSKRETAEETNPDNTLILDFQNREEINFYCLSQAVCGTLLWQPWQTNT